MLSAIRVPGHEGPGHVVADESHRDVVGGQLIGGEPCPLEQGAGLIGVYHGHLPLGVGRPDHPQGRPIAPGGQGPGVAVGEDTGPQGDQIRAKAAHGPVHLQVLPVDGLGLPLQPGQVGAPGAPAGLHPVQGPEQIDRRGPAGGQLLLGPGHEGGKVGGTGPLPGGQHRGIGRRHPDGGRPPDHHGPDGPDHLPVVGAGEPALLQGQSGLVQQREGIVVPADRFHGCGLRSNIETVCSMIP